MTNDDPLADDAAQDLAAASSVQEFAVALDRLDAQPRDYVVATPDAVVVGGNAEATIDGVTYRNDGDEAFTRHELKPAVVDPTPSAPLRVPDSHDSAAEDSAAEEVAVEEIVAEDSSAAQVRGLTCQRGHMVHPEARMCPLCGDNLQNKSIVFNDDGTVGELGPRPPLGVVILPDGQSFQLERTTIIGRAPEIHDDVQGARADFIRIDDSELSRVHFRFVLDEWNVLAEDLGSTNGTMLGAGSETLRLEPGTPVRLVSGAEIIIGTTTLSFQPTSAAKS